MGGALRSREGAVGPGEGLRDRPGERWRCVMRSLVAMACSARCCTSWDWSLRASPACVGGVGGVQAGCSVKLLRASPSCVCGGEGEGGSHTLAKAGRPVTFLSVGGTLRLKLGEQ